MRLRSLWDDVLGPLLLAAWYFLLIVPFSTALVAGVIWSATGSDIAGTTAVWSGYVAGGLLVAAAVGWAVAVAVTPIILLYGWAKERGRREGKREAMEESRRYRRRDDFPDGDG